MTGGCSRSRGAAAVVLAAALCVATAALASPLAYDPPERVGTIRSPHLAEASGLVHAAGRAPALWWAVNDSGNPPLLHAVDRQGRLVASIRVTGATNRDWEDLGAAPDGRGGRALFIADIGDNSRERDDLVVYRVREPRLDARATARAGVLPFRYPDGRFDAESIAVDPESGRIYVLTKGATTRVYRFPLPLRPGRRVTLERVATVLGLLPLATGAAVSPDGRRLTVRTYLDAYEQRRPRGAPFERLFALRPERVRLAGERQGEAIAYTQDGSALVTTSEQLPAPIWRYGRSG
jgi:hypothetical protein